MCVTCYISDTRETDDRKAEEKEVDQCSKSSNKVADLKHSDDDNNRRRDSSEELSADSEYDSITDKSSQKIEDDRKISSEIIESSVRKASGTKKKKVPHDNTNQPSNRKVAIKSKLSSDERDNIKKNNTNKVSEKENQPGIEFLYCFMVFCVACCFQQGDILLINICCLLSP